MSLPNDDKLTTKSSPQLPQSSPGWNLVKTFKSFRLIEDDEGHAFVLPVIITDPQQSSMVPMGVYLGTSVAKQGSNPGNGPWTFSTFEAYNGTTYDQARTPYIFKSAVATTAAATDIWTPATGKTVRILGGHIDVPGTCTLAAAATQLLRLYDSLATAYLYIDFSCRINNAVGMTNYTFPFDLRPAGIKLSAANSVAQFAMTANLTAGEILVNLWGTEE